MGHATVLAESTYLFAMPRWSLGAGRMLDLVGTADEYNESLNTQQADTLALWMDWQAVGRDMRYALDQFEPPEGAA